MVQVTDIHLSHHAKQQAIAKGWTEFQILRAARHPDLVYKCSEANQERHVRGDIVTVINTTTGCVITCYLNLIETPLRPDQVAL